MRSDNSGSSTARANASLLREMIGFTAQRLMELEGETLRSARHNAVPPASTNATSSTTATGSRRT
jgi:hypothetical protein